MSAGKPRTVPAATFTMQDRQSSSEICTYHTSASEVSWYHVNRAQKTPRGNTKKPKVILQLKGKHHIKKSNAKLTPLFHPDIKDGIIAIDETDINERTGDRDVGKKQPSFIKTSISGSLL